LSKTRTPCDPLGHIGNNFSFDSNSAPDIATAHIGSLRQDRLLLLKVLAPSCQTYADADAQPDTHTNSKSYRYGNSYRYRYTYCYCYCYCHSDSDGDSNAAAYAVPRQSRPQGLGLLQRRVRDVWGAQAASL